MKRLFIGIGIIVIAVLIILEVVSLVEIDNNGVYKLEDEDYNMTRDFGSVRLSPGVYHGVVLVSFANLIGILIVIAVMFNITTHNTRKVKA